VHGVITRSDNRRVSFNHVLSRAVHYDDGRKSNMDEIQTIYRKGYDIGVGAAMASGSPKSLAVVGEITHVHNAPGTGGVYTFNEIKSTEDLESKLGISAEAGGGVGLFSASARFDFSRQCAVQNTSICSLVTGVRNSGFEQINSPRFSDEAASLVAAGQSEAFLERYGDVFVRGIDRGGVFFGFCRIDTHSEESREKMSLKVSASYGMFSAKVAVDMENAAKETNSKITVQFHYEGGIVRGHPTTPTELLAAYDEWINSVDASAQAYNVTMDSYALVAGPPPPNAEDLQNQHKVLARCATLRAQVTDRMNLISYITDPSNSKDFEFVDSPAAPDLAALSQGLALDLDLIHEAASFALANPKEAKEVETYARTIRTPTIPDYKLTLLPSNMPHHSGATVVVPSFIGFSDNAAQTLAADNRLTLHWSYTGDGRTEVSHNVLTQDPPPGAEASPGATVNLTLPETPSHRRSEMLLGGVAGPLPRFGA
jgi:hypothetical protein